ncbi:MAG: hypothetical protein QW085_02935, partial [Pyrobaculum sp.]
MKNLPSAEFSQCLLKRCGNPPDPHLSTAPLRGIGRSALRSRQYCRLKDFDKSMSIEVRLAGFRH